MVSRSRVVRGVSALGICVLFVWFTFGCDGRAWFFVLPVLPGAIAPMCVWCVSMVRLVVHRPWAQWPGSAQRSCELSPSTPNNGPALRSPTDYP